MTEPNQRDISGGLSRVIKRRRNVARQVRSRLLTLITGEKRDVKKKQADLCHILALTMVLNDLSVIIEGEIT